MFDFDSVRSHNLHGLNNGEDSKLPFDRSQGNQLVFKIAENRDACYLRNIIVLFEGHHGPARLHYLP